MYKYEKGLFTEVVNKSKSLSDVARFLDLEPSKGNRDTIKKYIEIYKLSTEHFSYVKRSNESLYRNLEEILVINSTYSRGHLKNRLYKEGLKFEVCELCGQGNEWNGKRISLILDHINGINNDNRLKNLRILCPNCNATLDTHCGKNKSKYKLYQHVDNDNTRCNDCACLISKGCIRCSKCESINQRKVERPNYSTLIDNVKEFGYTKTGKKYGVSDNCIRKWIKIYEKNLE